MADPARGAAQHPLAAVALTVTMSALFASMDTLVRALGPLLPMAVLLAWRYVVQAGVMGAWLAWRRWQGDRGRFTSRRPGFQVLRGVLLLASSGLSFLALQHLPVAEFTAVAMLGPVLVTLLSALWLREHVSVLRWALLVGSVVGALIVIRPGSGLFGAAALLPLGGASCYAVFQVLTRKYALVENPYATHFWTGIVGSVLVLPLVLAQIDTAWPRIAALAPWQAVGMLAIGLLGTGGHLLLVLAARMAPPAALMPFIYTQLGFAALAGWLVFGRLPDTWGWVGMGVIAACGAAAAWLHARRR